MALSINGWSITGGTANGTGSQVEKDIEKAETDTQANASSGTLEQDYLQLGLDADANGATQTATDAKNAAISLNNGTYNQNDVQNKLAIDATAFPTEVGGSSGGPDSLKDSWGINGTGNSSNVISDLSSLLSDAGAGKVGGLQQKAEQTALDANAAGNSKLAADAEHVARSLSDGSFSLSASIALLKADQ